MRFILIFFLIIFATLSVYSQEISIRVEWDYEVYATHSYLRLTVENPQFLAPLVNLGTANGRKLIDIAVPSVVTAILYDDIRCNIDSQQKRFLHADVDRAALNRVGILYTFIPPTAYSSITCVIPFKPRLTPFNPQDNRVRVQVMAPLNSLYTKEFTYTGEFPPSGVTVDSPKSNKVEFEAFINQISQSSTLEYFYADPQTAYEVPDTNSPTGFTVQYKDRNPPFVKSNEEYVQDFKLPWPQIHTRLDNWISISYPFKLKSFSYDINECPLQGSLVNMRENRFMRPGEVDPNNPDTMSTAVAFAAIGAFRPCPTCQQIYPSGSCKYNIVPWIPEGTVTPPAPLQFNFLHSSYVIPSLPVLMPLPGDMLPHETFYRSYPLTNEMKVMPTAEFFYAAGSIISPAVVTDESITMSSPFLMYDGDQGQRGTAAVSNTFRLNFNHVKLDRHAPIGAVQRLVFDLPARMGYIPDLEGRLATPDCSGLDVEFELFDTGYTPPGTTTPTDEAYIRFTFSTTDISVFSASCTVGLWLQPREAFSIIDNDQPQAMTLRDSNDISVVLGTFPFFFTPRYMPKVEIFADEGAPLVSEMSGGILHVRVGPRTFESSTQFGLFKTSHPQAGFALNVRGPSIARAEDLILSQTIRNIDSLEATQLPTNCVSCFKISFVEEQYAFVNPDGDEVTTTILYPRLILGPGDYKNMEFDIVLLYSGIYHVQELNYSIREDQDLPPVEMRGYIAGVYHSQTLLSHIEIDPRLALQPEIHIDIDSVNGADSWDMEDKGNVDFTLVNMLFTRYDEMILSMFNGLFVDVKHVPCFMIDEDGVSLLTEEDPILSITINKGQFEVYAVRSTEDSYERPIKCRTSLLPRLPFDSITGQDLDGDGILDGISKISDFLVRSAVLQERMPSYEGAIHSSEYFTYEILNAPKNSKPPRLEISVDSTVPNTVYLGSTVLIVAKLYNISSSDGVAISFPGNHFSPVDEGIEAITTRYTPLNCPLTVSFSQGSEFMNVLLDLGLERSSDNDPIVCEFLIQNVSSSLNEPIMNITGFHPDQPEMCSDSSCVLTLAQPYVSIIVEQRSNEVTLTLAYQSNRVRSPAEVAVINIPGFSRSESLCIEADSSHSDIVLGTVSLLRGLSTLQITPHASNLALSTSGRCSFKLHADIPIAAQTAYVFYDKQLLPSSVVFAAIDDSPDMASLPVPGLDVHFSQARFAALPRPVGSIYIKLGSERFFAGDHITFHLPQGAYWVQVGAPDYSSGVRCDLDAFNISQTFNPRDNTYTITATIRNDIDNISSVDCAIQVGFKTPLKPGNMRSVFRRLERDNNRVVIINSTTGTSTWIDTLFPLPYANSSSDYAVTSESVIRPQYDENGQPDYTKMPSLDITFHYSSTLLSVQSNILAMEVGSWRVQDPRTKASDDKRILECFLPQVDVLGIAIPEEKLARASQRLIVSPNGAELRISLPPVAQNEDLEIRCILPLTIYNRSQYLTPFVIESNSKNRQIATFRTPNFVPKLHYTIWDNANNYAASINRPLDIRKIPITRLMLESDHLFDSDELNLIVTTIYNVMRSRDNRFPLNSLVIIGQYRFPVAELKQVVMVTIGFASLSPTSALIRSEIAGVDFVRYLSNYFPVFLDPAQAPSMLIHDVGSFNFGACPLDRLQSAVSTSCGPECGRTCPKSKDDDKDTSQNVTPGGGVSPPVVTPVTPPVTPIITKRY